MFNTSFKIEGRSREKRLRLSLYRLCARRCRWRDALPLQAQRRRTPRSGRLVLHVSEFVDKNPNVLAVVDRNGDQVQPPGGKCLLQRRHQPRRRRYPPTSGAVGGGVRDEVRIVEGQAPV